MPGFSSLPAVQTGRVYVVDHGFYSRPGPRLIDGVELLVKLVYGVGPTPNPLGAQPYATAAVMADGSSGTDMLKKVQEQQQQHKAQQVVDGNMQTAESASDVLVMEYDRDTGNVAWLPCVV